MCRSLGCTLEELDERMSLHEFNLWWREYLRRPWGEYRDSLHAAQIVQSVENAVDRSTQNKARVEAVSLTDCVLDFDREDTPKTEIDPATFFSPLVNKP